MEAKQNKGPAAAGTAPGTNTGAAPPADGTLSTPTSGAASKKAARGAGARAEGPPGAPIFDKLSESYGTIDDGNTPADVLEFFILSHLLLHLSLADALRAFTTFKGQFVDWNEVRISSAKDVQDIVRNAPESLGLAIFIKGFLDRLFNERHHVSFEFLHQMTAAEIRSFLKKSPGVADSTVTLLLTQYKEQAQLPLEAWMVPCATRLGLVKHKAPPVQSQKELYEKMGREKTLERFGLLAQHARSVCVQQESAIACGECVARKACPYPKKNTHKARKQ